jgi:hypothetical protein
MQKDQPRWRFRYDIVGQVVPCDIAASGASIHIPTAAQAILVCLCLELYIRAGGRRQERPPYDFTNGTWQGMAHIRS